MPLLLESMSAEAFAPFGRLLDGAGSRPLLVNQGRATRCDLVAFAGGTGRTALARYDVAGTALPFEIALIERHRLSDQGFFALDGATAIVVVAGSKGDGSPDLARTRAFIARPETPFLYAAGTWHAPLFALAGGGAFLMAMHESGTPADCETFELTTPVRVEQGSWDAGIG